MVQEKQFGVVRSERFWASVLVAAFAGYMLLTCRFGISVYDEGVNLYGASLVLDGQMVYRDFWTVYPPGRFYALAGLFRVFGPSILVERLFWTIVHVLLVICVYFVAKRLGGRWAGVFAMALAMLLVGGNPLYGGWQYHSVLVSLAGCLCVIEYMDCRRWVWLAAAGALVGISTLLRHDFGFYTFGGVSAVIVLFACRSAAQKNPAGGGKVLAVFRAYGVFVAAVAILLVPVAVVLLVKVGVKELVWDLVIFPGTVLNKFRWLPYPSLWPGTWGGGGVQTFWGLYQTGLARFAFYVPVAFVLAILQISVSGRGREKVGPGQWGAVLMVLVGMGFFIYACGRTDIAHISATNVVAVILLAGGVFGFYREVKSRGHFVLWVISVAIGVLTVLSFGQIFVRRASNIFSLWDRGEYAQLQVERGRDIWVTRAACEELGNAVGYIQEHVRPDEKIFVCNFRHDNIFANDVIFYFLAERHCASKYHNLDPGVATTLAVQSEIVGELEKEAVRYIVVVTWPRLVSKEPNMSSKSSGVRVLDSFIASHYKYAESFGFYMVIRKEQSARHSGAKSGQD